MVPAGRDLQPAGPPVTCNRPWPATGRAAR